MNGVTDDEFFFAPLELQTLQYMNKRIQHLISQATGLLPRFLVMRNASQIHDLANLVRGLADQLNSTQKRRLQMLASAHDVYVGKVIVNFGRTCDDCKNRPTQKSNFVVLRAFEACPPQPKLERILDLVDHVEQLQVSGFNSRARFRRTNVASAISALKSALLRQKAPLPRFRKSGFHPEPEIVVLSKKFHCTVCGKFMRYEYVHEDPRYLRRLRRREEREARQNHSFDQEKPSTIERELE